MIHEFSLGAAHLYMSRIGGTHPLFTFSIFSKEALPMQVNTAVDPVLNKIAPGTHRTSHISGPDHPKNDLEREHAYQRLYSVPTEYAMTMAKLFEDGGISVTRAADFVEPAVQKPLEPTGGKLATPLTLEEFGSMISFLLTNEIERPIDTTRRHMGKGAA